MRDPQHDNHEHIEDESPVSHIGLETRHATLPAEISRLLSPDEQDGFFFTLIDSAADAMIAHRPDGSVVYANREAADLLGYDSTERLLSLPPYGWIDPKLMSTAPRRLEQILTDGTSTFESGALRRDGSIIPTEVRVRRVDTPIGPTIVSIIRDISLRLANRAALEHLAYHDGLTGLSNRVHFEDRLTLAIADARRYGDRLALAYVDLDRFKPVNDRYGHAAGDEVLIEVARRLRAGVREQDTVGRLGGDEFVIVIPRLEADEFAGEICERLVSSIAEPILVDEHTIAISASIGLAIFDPASDDHRSLLVKADLAMYSAKTTPDQTWLTYREGMRLPDERSPEHPGRPIAS